MLEGAENDANKKHVQLLLIQFNSINEGRVRIEEGFIFIAPHKILFIYLSYPLCTITFACATVQ